jgi:hypothetical protein
MDASDKRSTASGVLPQAQTQTMTLDEKIAIGLKANMTTAQNSYIKKQKATLGDE